MLAILAALPCEARPLIQHYQLKAQTDSLFPVYSKDKVHLIISGVGKINAAQAVGYLQAKYLEPNSAWLNIGIAGHRSLPINAHIIAHKVIDHATQRSFYPAILKSLPKKTYTVCTVDQPEKNFSDDHVYEMEASGFMQAALKFSTMEFIHCYKIISDNLETKVCINPQSVQKLIENNTSDICLFADSLLDFNKEIKGSAKVMASLELFTSKWHFTVTQTHQLTRLLSRYFCFQTLSNDFLQEFCELDNASKVLYALEQKINSIPLKF